jgi:hypothetical protein
MQPGTPTKAAASPKITGRCGWGFLAFLHVGVSWGGCLDLHLRMDAACPVTVQVPLLENDMATAVKRAPAHTKAGLKQDRSRVAGQQDYEVAYEAKKTGATRSPVKAAVKNVGNSRKAVEKAIANR